MRIVIIGNGIAVNFADDDPEEDGYQWSEYQCRNINPISIANGSHVNRTINITIQNNGNCAIYNFAFYVNGFTWEPELYEPRFYWVDNNVTYYDVVTPTFDILDVGQSMNLQIDVFVVPYFSGYLERFIYYDGYYYDDGSTGNPTEFREINGGNGIPDIMDDLMVSLWIEVLPVPSGPTEVNLDEGWNLISLPLQAGDVSIPNALVDVLGKWDYIMAYDASDPDPWKTNNTYRPDFLNDLEDLNNKMGFWINITEPGCSISFDSQPGVTLIPLYAGWNLVGYPTLTDTVTVGSAFFGTMADRVQVCDQSEPYHLKEIDGVYIMQPGEGYWVHVPADTVWVVDW